MKTIEIDDDIYQYIAGNTVKIGESASDILRRLLLGTSELTQKEIIQESPNQALEKTEEESSVESTADEVEVQNESETIQLTTESEGTVFDFLNKEDLNMQKGAVGRFLFILSTLSRAHKENFKQVLNIKGRNRLYFANSDAELKSSGSSTNPKQIPNTDYWVITNSNTTRKKLILTEVAKSFGYSDEQVEQIREML